MTVILFISFSALLFGTFCYHRPLRTHIQLFREKIIELNWIAGEHSNADSTQISLFTTLCRANFFFLCCCYCCCCCCCCTIIPSARATVMFDECLCLCVIVRDARRASVISSVVWTLWTVNSARLSWIICHDNIALLHTRLLKSDSDWFWLFALLSCFQHPQV